MKSKEEQEEVIDITETRREVSTQTEPLPELISCGVQVEQLPVPTITRDFANQFPQDASVEVRNDHSYVEVKSHCVSYLYGRKGRTKAKLRKL